MVSKILLEMLDGRSSLAILSMMELLLLLLLLMLTAMILRCRRDDDDGLQSETKKRGVNAMVRIYERDKRRKIFRQGPARFNTDSNVGT